MVYKTTFFRKQLRQAFADTRTGYRRQAAFALFSGLWAFALYFVLQTLQRSVLAEAAPQIFQRSYFSTAFLYIHAGPALMTLYFLLYYEHIFFTDIRRNIWYLLIQLGHPPMGLIFQKTIAWMLVAVGMYAGGFVFAVLLTSLLRFTFVPAYLPGLFLVGLWDVILIGAAMMTISLYVKTTENARLIAALFFAALYALKALTGFYAVLSNRAAMQNIGNLFRPSRSVYMFLSAGLMLLFLVLGILAARRLSRYYITPGDGWGPLPPGVRVFLPGEAAPEPRRRVGIWGHLATALLALILTAALLFNALVLAMGLSRPGQELTIGGVIPYIFQSDTMEPAISYNDLAFFRRIDSQYPLSVGDIVLFESDGSVYVERILALDAGGVTVDIDSYPPLAEKGALRQTVPRENIYGLFVGRSRWLGVPILFANTPVGRVTLLLLPAVLLFYRRQVFAALRRLAGRRR